MRDIKLSGRASRITRIRLSSLVEALRLRVNILEWREHTRTHTIKHEAHIDWDISIEDMLEILKQEEMK